MSRISCLTLALLTAASAAHADAPDRGLAGLDEIYPKLDALYLDLHRNPELSMKEDRTAARLASELKALGYQVTTGVGGTGVVGVLKNGNGPTVLVRTELDALPIEEKTGLPYASTVKAVDLNGKTQPVMHACGHDIHMAGWTGAAALLARHKDLWHGTVVMIGQPGEEVVQGARAMIADGLFKRFPRPDFAIAVHDTSDEPAGKVLIVPGFGMASVDSVDVTIFGRSGHGAKPHTTVDPVVIAARTVLALQTLISREKDPLEPGVITVGSIHGGTKHNIIPDEVKLQLTVRTFTDEVRAHTLEAIQRIVRGQAVSAGLPEDRMPLVKIEEEESISASYNTPELARRVAKSLRDALGDAQVVERRPTMGGEDFGEYGRTTDKIPICIFWLGAVEPERMTESARSGRALPPLHSSLFRPAPEPTLKTGVTAMTAAVLGLAGVQ
jgi:hippurate hydrolase